jgi:hypothetical protein
MMSRDEGWQRVKELLETYGGVVVVTVAEPNNITLTRWYVNRHNYERLFNQAIAPSDRVGAQGVHQRGIACRGGVWMGWSWAIPTWFTEESRYWGDPDIQRVPPRDHTLPLYDGDPPT